MAEHQSDVDETIDEVHESLTIVLQQNDCHHSGKNVTRFWSVDNMENNHPHVL